jgi:hypothetical protein
MANNFDVKPNMTSIISCAEMPESIIQMTGIRKERVLLFWYGGCKVYVDSHELRSTSRKQTGAFVGCLFHKTVISLVVVKLFLFPVLRETVPSYSSEILVSANKWLARCEAYPILMQWPQTRMLQDRCLLRRMPP